ncbi:hypothetical protein GWK47_013482 [Chionoecetes opilio]|uniref:Uncharacterized protein n=1 Tax=Chionoecetes opilio TaxID=41210 RepID=A0A8J4Y0M0_CHIOP|nr:hypothetical protein GWK47_013482 [Chionoecetes opilio]
MDSINGKEKNDHQLMKFHSKKYTPMYPKSELPREGDMDRSSPILDDFDEELFICTMCPNVLMPCLKEVGKELDRYKEESSKSHESEGGSHPSVVHKQPGFTYLHCLPHSLQDTSSRSAPVRNFAHRYQIRARMLRVFFEKNGDMVPDFGGFNCFEVSGHVNEADDGASQAGRRHTEPGLYLRQTPCCYYSPALAPGVALPLPVLQHCSPASQGGGKQS